VVCFSQAASQRSQPANCDGLPGACSRQWWVWQCAKLEAQAVHKVEHGQAWQTFFHGVK
jgi:hypothetical protein